jgi:hypothetical protein
MVRSYLYFSSSRGGRFMYNVHKDVLRLCLVHCKLRAGENPHVHECRNWERGRPVSFLGIHKSYFRYSVLHPISHKSRNSLSPQPTLPPFQRPSADYSQPLSGNFLPETTSIWIGIYLPLL